MNATQHLPTCLAEEAVGSVMKNKTPKSFNLPVKLPAWAQWCAMDGFGVLVAFESEPIWLSDGNWLVRVGRRKDILQFENQSFKGWRKTLSKLA